MLQLLLSALAEDHGTREDRFTEAVPGGDAKLLNAGRAICSMLKGGVSGQYVDTEVGSYLGMNPHSAGQVVDSATEYICPRC